jgi:hypothetical protein
MLGPTNRSDKWEDVIFQFGNRAFLCGEASRIIGYGSTQGEAEQIVRRFTETYSTIPCHIGGSFQLIRQDRNETKCSYVTTQ